MRRGGGGGSSEVFLAALRGSRVLEKLTSRSSAGPCAALHQNCAVPGNPPLHVLGDLLACRPELSPGWSTQAKAREGMLGTSPREGMLGARPGLFPEAPPPCKSGVSLESGGSQSAQE